MLFGNFPSFSVLSKYVTSTSNLTNYFNFYVCLSFGLCVPCVQNLGPIPAVVSQNVTNKSYLVCVRVKNMYSGSPSDPWGP